jgi:hypothetical protein
MSEKTKLIMVEAISQYRIRYVVEVPENCVQWALDTVVCEEAKEFSQNHLGEVIFSHREVKKEELLPLMLEDNKYGTEKSVEKSITYIKDYKK